MKVIATIGLLLSVFGVYEGFKISHVHFNTIESCPTIGLLPACYVVLIAYSLMSLAWVGTLSQKISFLEKKGSVLFWAGFTPTFLLALTGIIGEIFGFVDCPETANHFPKCFISFGFVVVIGGLWVGGNVLKRTSKT